MMAEALREAAAMVSRRAVCDNRQDPFYRSK
jgi:hypothetical protein